MSTDTVQEGLANLSLNLSSTPKQHTRTEAAVKVLRLASSVALPRYSAESDGGVKIEPTSSAALKTCRKHTRASPNTTKPVITKPSGLPRVRPVKVLSEATRDIIERKLGYFFENPDLLWEAIQAAGNGITQIGDRKVDNGNKRLALLGDTMIKTAVMDDWIETGESRRQGHETAMNVGTNRHLATCGCAAGLEQLINPNPYFEKGGRVIPNGTMATTVEALVGAVWLDSGRNLKAVKRAMKGLGLYDV